jgi:hypothetical protein
MTPAEMKTEAEAAIKPIVASRQRGWVMKDEELTTMLINAYCRGHKAGVDKSVAIFAPGRLAQYNMLAALPD